jgi:hypothetical protein
MSRRGETIVAHLPGEVLQPVQKDEHGNPKRGARTDVEVPGCSLAPHDADETRGTFGPVTTTSYHVYAPTDLEFPPDTIFTIRGVSGWLMEGEVGQWTSPYSARGKGVEFTVKRGS